MNNRHGWIVMGHFGADNVGDEGMLLGLVRGMTHSGLVPITIASKGARLPPSVRALGVEAVDLRPLAIWTRCKSAEGVILGGGTHFHDDFQGWRVLHHVRYMLFFVLSTVLAKILGAKVCWLGQGIGPVTRWSSRLLIRLGTSWADAVTTRDVASLRELLSVAPHSRATHTFDLAALAADEYETRSPINERPPVLGVSVTSVPTSKTRLPHEGDEFWHELARALERELRVRPNLELRIFLFSKGRMESDVALSEQLLSRMQDVKGRVRLVDLTQEPEHALREVAACRYFIATRYHSAMFAYLVGARLLLLRYHRKLADFSVEVGLPPSSCLDLSAPNVSTRVHEVVAALLADSDDYVPSLPRVEAIRRSRQNIAIISMLKTGILEEDSGGSL